MRQRTRRKYYGRSNIASALRSALAGLQQAIALVAEDTISQALQEVLADLNRALEAERVYMLGRKRIRAKLEREKRTIEGIIAEVIAVPVLSDEKLLAKQRRRKRE